MKNLKTYYLITSLIILLFYFLAYFSVYIKGENSTRIIAWLWIILTLIFILKYWKSKVTKLYTLILGIILILSILPMGIPFFLIVSFLFNLNHRADYALDEKLKIHQKQFIMDKEKLYVEEKVADYILFEKIKQIGVISYDDIKSEFYPNIESDTISKPIQNIKLINRTAEDVIVAITIDQKVKEIEIPLIE